MAAWLRSILDRPIIIFGKRDRRLLYKIMIWVNISAVREATWSNVQIYESLYRETF